METDESSAKAASEQQAADTTSGDPMQTDDEAATPSSRFPVSVTATYTIRDESSSTTTPPIVTTETCRFDARNTTEERMGLPPGQEPTKPPAGSFTYSGMHDQGPLLPPKEGGDIARRRAN